MGYALGSLLHQRGQHFLIRVGANVRLLTRLGYAVREYDGLVYLWPDRDRKDGRPPLVLRLLRFREGDRERCLLTNVLDPALLSQAQAGKAYHLRWGIELWFRQLKQTAARRQLASRAPRQATLELAWLGLAMTLLGMLGVREALLRGRHPLDHSPAGTLHVLRDLARRPELRGGDRALQARLSRAVRDPYPRKAPKVRVVWAAKKQSRPPGAPRITPATAAQVAAATRLRSALAVP